MKRNYLIKQFVLMLFVCCSLNALAWEREVIWPKGKMPDAQTHQIAAMTDEVKSEKCNPDKNRVP